MELQQFSTILKGFLSNDTITRKNSENTFNQLKLEQPDKTVSLILQAISSSNDDEIRLQAIVLTRNIFKGLLQSKDNIWQLISADTKNQVKITLLLGIERETNKLARSNLCDTISDLAIELVPSDEWADLGEYLFKLIASPNVIHQQCSLKILAELVSVFSNKLSQNVDAVTNIVERCLQSDDLEVRSECVGFIAAIVEDGNRKVAKPLSKLLPFLVQTISVMIQNAKNTSSYQLINKTLEWLIQIAESQRGYGVIFLKPQLETICNQLFEIALLTLENDDDGDDEESELWNCQKAAVEVLLCLSENKPKVVLKVPNILQNTIDTLMRFMLDIRKKKKVPTATLR